MTDLGEFEPEVLRLSIRMHILYISLNVEVFKVVSALSLTNGSEKKKVHRV